jgi:hypothetical protein
MRETVVLERARRSSCNVALLSGFGAGGIRANPNGMTPVLPYSEKIIGIGLVVPCIAWAALEESLKRNCAPLKSRSQPPL